MQLKVFALCKPTKNSKIQCLLEGLPRNGGIQTFLRNGYFSWTFILLHILEPICWGLPLHPITENCCKTINMEEQIRRNIFRLNWDEGNHPIPVELSRSRSLPRRCSQPVNYQHLAQTITKCISAPWLGRRSQKRHGLHRWPEGINASASEKSQPGWKAHISCICWVQLGRTEASVNGICNMLAVRSPKHGAKSTNVFGFRNVATCVMTDSSSHETGTGHPPGETTWNHQGISLVVSWKIAVYAVSDGHVQVTPGPLLTWAPWAVSEVWQETPGRKPANLPTRTRWTKPSSRKRCLKKFILQGAQLNSELSWRDGWALDLLCAGVTPLHLRKGKCSQTGGSQLILLLLSLLLLLLLLFCRPWKSSTSLPTCMRRSIAWLACWVWWMWRRRFQSMSSLEASREPTNGRHDADDWATKASRAARKAVGHSSWGPDFWPWTRHETEYTSGMCWVMWFFEAVSFRVCLKARTDTFVQMFGFCDLAGTL